MIVFSFMFSDNFLMELVSAGLPKNRNDNVTFSAKKCFSSLLLAKTKDEKVIIITLRAFSIL